jgi:uncharacterized membrane protein
MIDALDSSSSGKRFLSDSGVALIVYILYLIGFVTGITALVGVIVAHLYRGSATQQVVTHLRFQVRTFWVGAIYFVLGCLLWYFIIGILLLLWWGAWTFVRVIRGMLLLNDGKPIPNPKSFMFGGSEDSSTVISSTDSARRVVAVPNSERLFVLLVAVVLLSLLALELGLVPSFWRGFVAGLTDTISD